MIIKLQDVFYGSVQRLEVDKMGDGVSLDLLYFIGDQYPVGKEVHILKDPEKADQVRRGITEWLREGSFVDIDYIIYNIKEGIG